MPIKREIPTSALRSTSAASIAPTLSPQVTYHGEHPDGRHRVKVDGQKALVSGKRQHVIFVETSDGPRKKFGRFSITLDYQLGLAQGEYVCFIAHETKANKLYQISGRLQYLASTAPTQEAAIEPLSCNVTQIAHDSAAPDLQTPNLDHLSATPFSPLTTASTEPQHLERARRQDRAFKRELESVAAQRAAGFDPKVSIAFASRIANRSRATLYRDFGVALPMPTKVGKSSLIPYSAVEAYISGRHVNPTDLGQRQ